MNPNTLFAATSSQNLWTDHPATATQRKRYGRTTQCDVLAFMLREAHAGSRALDLPDIMAAGIAQHGARFAELRQRGFVIDNELERAADGHVLSRYWLRHDPELNRREP